MNTIKLLSYNVNYKSMLNIDSNCNYRATNFCKNNIVRVFKNNPCDFFLIQEASGFEDITFPDMEKIHFKSGEEESIIYYNTSFKHIEVYKGEFETGRPYIIAEFSKDKFITVIINVHLPESVMEDKIKIYRLQDSGSYNLTDEEIITIIKYKELIKLEEDLDYYWNVKLKMETTRIIIAGDFNWDIKTTEDFDKDNFKLFDRLFQIESPRYNTCCDFDLKGKGNYTVKFDHVLFTKNNLKLIKLDNPLKGIRHSNYSDHLPIYCEIKCIDNTEYFIENIQLDTNNIIENFKKLKVLDENDLLNIPNCISSQLPSDSTKRPFFLFHGKPSSMINYHYIWVLYKKKTKDQILDSKIDSEINKIISDYSFPMCILNRNLSFSDKKEIINDEYTFIKSKILELEKETKIKIKLIQIPRIIYDLYGIIFFRNNIEMQNYFFNVDPIIDEKNSHHQFFIYINYEYDKQKSNIIKLNNEFISLMYEKKLIEKFLQSEINTDVYIELYEILFDIILKKKTLSMGLHKGISATLNKLKSIDTIENLFNYRFKSILYQTLLIELGFVYDNFTDKYILNERKDLFILYRGYSGNIFSTLNGLGPHSNSFNTSILNGIFQDITANTYNYMKPGCNKHFYLVPRFLPDSHSLLDAFNLDLTDPRLVSDKQKLLEAIPDNDALDNLLFIPPIHPFLLLYGNGEYWHARSKIHVESVTRPTGLADSVNVTNFIISKKKDEQLEDIFKIYFVNSEQPKVLVDKYYTKYLKYKNKYLSLKTSIKN